MTKQEKIAVKNSLAFIEESIFPQQWDELVAEHPYIMMKDDDIEDDVIIEEVTKGDTPVNMAKQKFLSRKARMYSTMEVREHFDELRDAMGIPYSNFAMIQGAAHGEEERSGFFFPRRGDVVPMVGDYAGDTNIIFAMENEIPYFESLGYRPCRDAIEAGATN